MKKTLLISVAFLSLLSSELCSQVLDTKYADLFDLVMLDDYEKCLKKAMKYTESDKTKKDAQPWLYVTISYYKISKNSELEAKYPDALMESIKAATKLRKTDKSQRVWGENQEFFDEYKAYVIDKFSKDVQNGSYKDATKYLKKFLTVDEDDMGIRIITGVTHILANKMEGLTMVENALDSLTARYNGKKYEAASKEKEELLQRAFAEYSALLAKKEDQSELAMRIIQTGKDIMTENDEVQRQFARMNRK